MYWHCKEKVGLDWFMGCSQERQHTNISGVFLLLLKEKTAMMTKCLPPEYSSVITLSVFLYVWAVLFCVDHCVLITGKSLTVILSLKKNLVTQFTFWSTKSKLVVSHWAQKINFKRLVRTSNPVVIGFTRWQCLLLFSSVHIKAFFEKNVQHDFSIIQVWVSQRSF